MAADLGDYWSKELIEGLARDPAAVLDDVERGAMSLDTAKWQCGVIFTGMPGAPGFAVDADATERMRSQLRVAGAAPSGS